MFFFSDPDLQKNFEEYDLSTMDSSNTTTHRNSVKKVSFQENESVDQGTLRRIPSQPKVNPTSPSLPPQVPARTLLPSTQQPTFTSFKSDVSQANKVLDNSTITKIDSSSVLGKLMNDSFINSDRSKSTDIDENLNVTASKSEYNYYF